MTIYRQAALLQEYRAIARDDIPIFAAIRRRVGERERPGGKTEVRTDGLLGPTARPSPPKYRPCVRTDRRRVIARPQQFLSDRRRHRSETSATTGQHPAFVQTSAAPAKAGPISGPMGAPRWGGRDEGAAAL